MAIVRVVLRLEPRSAAPQDEGMAAMMFWYGGHWAFWQAGMMWAGTIVFWALLIWGIFALVRFSRRPGEDDQNGDVRRILDERLARGEITPEEHQRILDLLNSGGPRTRATSQKKY